MDQFCQFYPVSQVVIDKTPENASASIDEILNSGGDGEESVVGDVDLTKGLGVAPQGPHKYRHAGTKLSIYSWGASIGRLTHHRMVTHLTQNTPVAMASRKVTLGGAGMFLAEFSSFHDYRSTNVLHCTG